MNEQPSPPATITYPEDYVKQPTEIALDLIWHKMYPGTDWKYPTQVSIHAKAVIDELEEELKAKKAECRLLKTELFLLKLKVAGNEPA